MSSPAGQSGGGGGSASSPAPGASGYFVDTKKGEVNELKLLLKNINVERDVKRKREIIKKVIAYMTLGIDVSRLFTDMIMVKKKHNKRSSFILTQYNSQNQICRLLKPRIL